MYVVEVRCLGLLCNIDEGSVRYFRDEIIQLQHIHNGWGRKDTLYKVAVPLLTLFSLILYGFIVAIMAFLIYLR